MDTSWLAPDTAWLPDNLAPLTSAGSSSSAKYSPARVKRELQCAVSKLRTTGWSCGRRASAIIQASQNAGKPAHWKMGIDVEGGGVEARSPHTSSSPAVERACCRGGYVCSLLRGPIRR